MKTYKNYNLDALVKNKPSITYEFGHLKEARDNCLLYYCDMQKRWYMISAKTGVHSIAGYNARRTKRVNEHWDGFLKNQQRDT